MRQRVACLNPTCGAHRDRALPYTELCFVCGCSDYALVPLNKEDLEDQIDQAFAHLEALLTLASAWPAQPTSPLRS